MKLKYNNLYITKYSMDEFSVGTYEEAKEFDMLRLESFINWFGITGYEVET